ncbi:MAG: LPS export ABC transporter permease LptF, partial [Pseudomonadota bacterium]
MIYERYILNNLLKSTLLFTITLTLVIWLVQSLRFIDLIVNKGLYFIDFIFLSSLIIPSLILVILPISLFSAMIFIYNKLISESELIVMRSSGLSHFQLAKPAIITACLVTIFGYLISLYVMPATFRAFKDKQAFIRDNYASLLFREKVFNSLTPEITIYIDNREYDGSFKGILVHDNRNAKHPVTMMAEEGKLIQDEQGNNIFNLLNGNRQEINRNNGQLSLLNFSQYNLDISQYNDESPIIRQREPKERYMHELLKPDKNISPNLKKELFIEAHRRISWPLFNVTLTLIAISTILSGQLNRRGLWKRNLVVISIAITFLAATIGMNG